MGKRASFTGAASSAANTHKQTHDATTEHVETINHHQRLALDEERDDF
jgi:hypothetical protein